MKNVIFLVLALVILGELVTLFVIKRKNSNQNVLAEATAIATPTETSTPTPTDSPTPVPTQTPSPTPTPTKAPTPVPKPLFSDEQVQGFIERFSSLYSVDPNLIRYIALCESGFNQNAYKLSYAGLFQFGPITWKNIRTKMGEDPNIELRFNAEEAVQTAAYALHINDAGIWPNCIPK